MNIQAVSPTRADARIEPKSAKQSGRLPTFVRELRLESVVNLAALPVTGAPLVPYVKDPFPKETSVWKLMTRLTGSRNLNERLKQALKHDLARLTNDLIHGKFQEASNRLRQMASVDISKCLMDCSIDPNLFTKLGAVIDNKKSTPIEILNNFDNVVQSTGAYGLMQSKPAATTPIPAER